MAVLQALLRNQAAILFWHSIVTECVRDKMVCVLSHLNKTRPVSDCKRSLTLEHPCKGSGKLELQQAKNTAESWEGLVKKLCFSSGDIWEGCETGKGNELLMGTEPCVWCLAQTGCAEDLCITGFWVLIKTPSETYSVLPLSSSSFNLNYGERAGVKPVLGFINQRYCVKCCKSRIYECGSQ